MAVSTYVSKEGSPKSKPIRSFVLIFPIPMNVFVGQGQATRRYYQCIEAML